MANFSAFQPQGATVTFATTTTSQVKQVPSNASDINYRFVNSGTDTIFWLANQTGGQTVTAANGIPMLPNTIETFTLPANAYIGVIGVAGGNNLYVTPGEGV